MMDLSRQQVGSLYRERPEDSYEWVDLPVGPQSLPSWAKGMEVWWSDGYGNPPSLTVITDLDEPRRWPGQVWDYEPPKDARQSGMYFTTHQDGRADAYWHGPLKFQRGTFWSTADRCQRETMRWMTDPSEGLAGSGIPITMRDGREAILRGPWCSAGPEGYQDIIFRRKARGVGTGGFLRNDVVIALFARYLPHLRLARVHRGGEMAKFGPKLEPVKPEWDEPKAWMLAKRRAA